MKNARISFIIGVLLIFGATSFAEVPRIMNYQAKLTNSSGVALNGSYSITFRIYDAETGGNLLWYQTKTVTVINGLFEEELDLSINGGDTLKFDRPYWLVLQVDGDPEMSPREKLAPVSFAFRSIYADTANYTASGGSGGAPVTDEVWPYSSITLTLSWQDLPQYSIDLPEATGLVVITAFIPSIWAYNNTQRAYLGYTTYPLVPR